MTARPPTPTPGVAAVLALALLLLSPPAPVRAERYAWDLADARAAARGHAPELRRARRAVREARGEAASSWNLLLPDLALGTSLSRSMFAEEAPSPWTAGVSASASIGLSPALDERIRSRHLAEEAAALEERRVAVQLEREVRERFYAVLLARRRVSIAERNAALAAQQLERARALYEQGRASRLDLLDARAAEIARRPELLTRRQDLFAELAALKELTGLEPTDELSVEGRIPVPEIDLGEAELRATVLAESLELRAARLALERSTRSRSITYRDTKLPRLSASYDYSPRVSPPFDGERWGGADTWRTGSLAVRLTIPLDPLIPRSAGDNDVRAAAGAVERARIDLAETEGGIARRASELARSVEVSRERLTLLGEALEIAEARYRETLTVYESGGVDSLDVEDARAALEEAELALLQERYTLAVTVSELDELAGGTILED